MVSVSSRISHLHNAFMFARMDIVKYDAAVKMVHHRFRNEITYFLIV